VALASGVQYAIMTPRPGIVQARAQGRQRASVRFPANPGSPAMPRGSQEPPFCTSQEGGSLLSIFGLEL
jgi:hypothetical protein